MTALQFDAVSSTDVAVQFAIVLVYLIGLTERTATRTADADDRHSNRF